MVQQVLGIETPQLIKARAVRAKYERDVAAINADTRLNAIGRAEMINDLYIAAKAELEGLRAEELRESTERRRRLERDIFGLPGTADPSVAISFRDAQDRANAIETEDEGQALRLLRQASQSGDTHLAKALITRAVEVGWSRVIDAYSAEHPGTEAKLAELTALSIEDGSLKNIVSRLAAEAVYMLSPPHVSRGR